MNIVSYKDVDVNNIIVKEPQLKTNPSGKAFAGEISYKFPTKEDKFKLEQCEARFSCIYKPKEEEGKPAQREKWRTNVTYNCYGDKKWKHG